MHRKQTPPAAAQALGETLRGKHGEGRSLQRWEAPDRRGERQTRSPDSLSSRPAKAQRHTGVQLTPTGRSSARRPEAGPGVEARGGLQATRSRPAGLAAPQPAPPPGPTVAVPPVRQPKRRPKGHASASRPGAGRAPAALLTEPASLSPSPRPRLRTAARSGNVHRAMGCPGRCKCACARPPLRLRPRTAVPRPPLVYVCSQHQARGGD